MPVTNEIDLTIEKLQSGTREDRKSAAIKLGRIRDPKSIPFLLRAIREDTYQLTRVFAIQSLTWIADQSVIPDLIEAGVDIINPVQFTADKMDSENLKEKYGDKITFWGGGVDTQNVLPFGTPEEVAEQVKNQNKDSGKSDSPPARKGGIP